MSIVRNGGSAKPHSSGTRELRVDVAPATEASFSFLERREVARQLVNVLRHHRRQSPAALQSVVQEGIAFLLAECEHWESWYQMNCGEDSVGSQLSEVGEMPARNTWEVFSFCLKRVLEALRMVSVLCVTACRCLRSVCFPAAASYAEGGRSRMSAYGMGLASYKSAEEEEGFEGGTPRKSVLHESKLMTERMEELLARLLAVAEAMHDKQLALHRESRTQTARSSLNLVTPANISGAFIPGSAQVSPVDSSRAVGSGLSKSSLLLFYDEDSAEAAEEKHIGVKPASALAYVRGELKDFIRVLRRRSKENLVSLCANPVGCWNVEHVLEALCNLSSFEGYCGFLQKKGNTSVAGTAESGEQINDYHETGLSCAAVYTSLRCPYSHRLILYPARGASCEHLDVFDAASFIRVLQAEGNASRPVVRPMKELKDWWEEGGARAYGWTPCPFCRKKLRIFDLRIDQDVMKAISCYRQASAPKDPNGLPVEQESDTAITRELNTSQHLLQWDFSGRQATCSVVCRDGSGCSAIPVDESDQHSRLSFLEEGVGQGSTSLPLSQNVAEEPAAGASRAVKRRRVDIAGHVLFVEE